MLKRSTRLWNWLGGAASGGSGLGLDVRSPHGQFVNVVAEGTQPRRATAAHFSVAGATHSGAFYEPEARHHLAGRGGAGTPRGRSSKYNRRLRADLYDELLKLPLRFALHDFEVLQRHLSNSLSSRAYIAGGAAAAAGKEEEDGGEGDTGVYVFKSGTGGDAGEKAEAAAALGGAAVDHNFYSVAGRVSAVGYAPPLGPADPIDVLPFFVHRTSNGQLPGSIHSMHARNLMPHFYMKIENAVEGDIFRFEEELMKIFPTKKIFVRSHCVYVYNVGKDGREVLHHWLLGLGF